MRELRAVALANGTIAIDCSRMTGDAEYKCALCHELGHCMTGSFYNVDSTEHEKELAEHRANRFAAELLVPLSKLRHIMHNRGILISRTLAMIFEVTTEFIEMVLFLFEQELASPTYRRVTCVNSMYSIERYISPIIQSVATTETS